MIHRRTFLIACLALLAAASGSVWSKAVQTDHVEAELVAEQNAVVPGKPLLAGLRLKMDEHWHTYWRNPGDTGLPTVIRWQLPTGFKAGEIDWPAPQRIDIGPFANYGYENEVVLPVRIEVPEGIAPGTRIPIKAHAEWLVCREQCIPGEAELDLDLVAATSSQADGRWSGLFAQASANRPVRIDDLNWTAYRTGQRIDLVWTPRAGAATPSQPQFFPYAEGLIEPAARQALYRLSDGRLRLSLAVARQPTATPAELEGVMTEMSGRERAARSDPAANVPRAIQVVARIDGTLPADAQGGTALNSAVSFASGAEPNAIGLAAALALALVGGLILNLMPCVFPVISLKVLGFAQQAHGHSSVIRRHGVVFAAGVVASFLVLAGIVLAVRAGGEGLGWGFQLQSPAVVTVLAVLFFLLALNIAGFFEVGMLLPSSFAAFEARNPYLNSFASGVLAVVIASPCTAPFMGAALGFALAQPIGASLSVFVALGVGMALPYLLLAWFPRWLKHLPRPGPWMVWLKQLLAIPLAATVIWLGWVLAQQAGVDAFARLLFVLLLVTVALWCSRQRLMSRAVSRVLALVAVGCAIWTAMPLIDDATPATPSQTRIGEWEPYSRARLDELGQAGRPVFVDFTAAWCVSCQANKKLVLERDETLRAFADKNVVLMRADWTRRDPVITAALSEFGRSGVPVYALYRPGKSTLVLQEILTAGAIREALQSL
ncbi:MAG: thioredoxin family protein [Betaproteobacteria bacterium]